MASPHNSSFADKLRSLGVKTGTAHLAPPKPGSRYGIDSVWLDPFSPPHLVTYLPRRRAILPNTGMAFPPCFLTSLSLLSRNGRETGEFLIWTFLSLPFWIQKPADSPVAQAHMPFLWVWRVLWMGSSVCSNSSCVILLRSLPYWRGLRTFWHHVGR